MLIVGLSKGGISSLGHNLHLFVGLVHLQVLGLHICKCLWPTWMNMPILVRKVFYVSYADINIKRIDKR